MLLNRYKAAVFLKSAPKTNQAPADTGYEVAFAGRSNAGKSSALNFLTERSQLARTSKTPGRTQLLNFFSFGFDDSRRLVDLPGYGYAKVPLIMKQTWEKNLAEYLNVRDCLRGIVLLMDCRHPLKNSDQDLLDCAIMRHLPVHILLTKSDKLSRGEAKSQLLTLQRTFDLYNNLITMQLFSTLKKEGKTELIQKLDHWFEWENND